MRASETERKDTVAGKNEGEAIRAGTRGEVNV